MYCTSNYPEGHKSKIPARFNSQVLGLLKDAGGLCITGFFGLQATLYVFVVESKTNKNVRVLRNEVLKCVSLGDGKNFFVSMFSQPNLPKLRR